MHRRILWQVVFQIAGKGCLLLLFIVCYTHLEVWCYARNFLAVGASVNWVGSLCAKMHLPCSRSLFVNIQEAAFECLLILYN